MTQTAISVTSWPGQPTVAEVDALARRDEAPRTDYVELARALDAIVVDGAYMTTRASRLSRTLWSHVRRDEAQAVELHRLRRNVTRVLAWNPGVSLTLALLSKVTRSRQRLVSVLVEMSPRQERILRRLALHGQMEAIVVDGGSPQVTHFRELGVPGPKLRFLEQRVDESFWRSGRDPLPRHVCAVGQGRDHLTLARAMAGSGLSVDVAVGSMVRTRAVETSVRAAAAVDWPPNVRFQIDVPYRDVRRMYERASVVVVPLNDVGFDAGATAITEAMSMGRPVVVSRVSGQVDLVSEGETGIYVPPGDPRALAEAVLFLTSNPAEAHRMGRAGRARVEARHALSDWVRAVAALMHGTERS